MIPPYFIDRKGEKSLCLDAVEICGEVIQPANSYPCTCDRDFPNYVCQDLLCGWYSHLIGVLMPNLGEHYMRLFIQCGFGVADWLRAIKAEGGMVRWHEEGDDEQRCKRKAREEKDDDGAGSV